MTLKTTVLVAAVVAASVQVATAATTTGDSISLVPSFVSATTTGGGTLNVLPPTTSGNIIHIYSSGQPGIYQIGYTVTANLTSGGFGEIAYSVIPSTGLSLPASPTYIPDTTGAWFVTTDPNTNQPIVLNGDFGVSSTERQDMIASYGPGVRSGSLTQPVGAVRIAWDGFTTATLQLGDSNSNVGQIEYQTTDPSTGELSNSQAVPDNWTVEFDKPISGDANVDGVVNDSDLNILLTNFGKSGVGWTGGDFTGSGTVNDSDLNLLLSNFGAHLPSGTTAVANLNLSAIGAVSAVPEPASLALLSVGALVLMRRRRA